MKRTVGLACRHLRLIARQRQKLGGMLASEKNRMHKVLADSGIRINVLVSDIHGQSARSMVKACIARFEQALIQGLHAWAPQLVLLQTIPGIDCMGATMLLVEISAEMQNFGSAERLASWVGICPGNNESAGKRKSGKTRKGNAWVCRLLCEFAQAASRSRCALKDKFAALGIRKGHKNSIVALAQKMLRIVFAVLKTRQPYRDRVVDYEALSVQRNAPRWIKMLVKPGFMPSAA